LVSNLENLVFLTIEGCDLRRVAVKDFCWPSLGFLALKDCKLQHIDLKWISSSVSTLDFDNNSLIDIKFPSDNMSIKKLYLNNNLFTEVPKGISQLKWLDSFYFADNNVVFIWDELNTLENLVILEMQDNKLSTLPYPTWRFEFINPNLVSINFTWNSELTELPFLYLNDSPFDATIYTDSNIPPEEVYKLWSNRTRYNRYRWNESVSWWWLSDWFEYMQNLSSTNNPAYEILSRMRNKKSTDQLDAFSVWNAVPELGEWVMSDAPLLIYWITLEW
jgi:hypothetical protein